MHFLCSDLAFPKFTVGNQFLVYSLLGDVELSVSCEKESKGWESVAKGRFLKQDYKSSVQ